MKFHELKLRAFGPYVTPVTIDFDVFNDGSLFIIHGPTGAGKSSLLDGICFALFGESSGANRDRVLRSMQARPDEDTEVSLTFSIGPKRYLINRKPSYLRPKMRGEGVTDSKAHASLRIFDEASPSGTILASKTKDVDAFIKELVGFDAPQFRQVICLPQGQVQEAIRADSRNRESLLQLLFQTDHYAQFSEFLSERAKKGTEALKGFRQTLGMLLEQGACESFEALEHRLSDLKTQRAEDQKKKGQFEARLAKIDRDILLARDYAAKRQRRRDAQTALDLLLAGTEERQRIRKRLSAASAARDILPLIQTHHDTTKRLEKASAQREKLALELAQMAPDIEGAQETFARYEAQASQRSDWEKQLNSWRRLQTILSEIQSVRETIGKQQNHGTRLLTSIETVQGQATLDAQKLADLDVSTQDAKARYAERHELQLQINAIRDHLKQQDDHRRLLKSRHEVSSNLEQIRKTLAQAIQHEQAAQSQLTLARQQHDQSILEVYAQQLVHDYPCPLCGSLDHPTPARAPEAKDQISVDDAEQHLAHQSAICATFKAQQESLTGQLETIDVDLQRAVPLDPDDQSPTKLDDLLERQRIAEQQSTILQTYEKTHQDLVRRQQESAQRIEKLKLDMETHQSELNKSEGQIISLQRQRDTALQELGETSVTIDDCRMRADELQNRIRDWDTQYTTSRDKLNGLLQSRKESQGQLNALEDRIRDDKATLVENVDNRDSAMEAAGFPDIASINKAVLPPAEWERLNRNLEQEEARCASLKEEIINLDQTLKTPPEHTDVEKLDDVRTTLRREMDDFLQKMGETGQTLEHLSALHQNYIDTQRRFAAQEKIHGTLGKLSELANGGASGMTLHRFVQRIYLDEVLHAANMRLSLVSRQRYQLVLQTQSSDRRKAFGLDIAVTDHWHGTERAIETLSGGESFLAALAFSLGLADIIQRHSGGIHLDSMFIDEGFGSLDPEALELARSALAGLGVHGRSVGIISHVPELREHINRGLAIKVSDEGSSVAAFGV